MGDFGRPFLTFAVATVLGCAAPSAPLRKPHLELSTETTAGLVAADLTSPLAVRIRVAANRLPDVTRQPLNLVLVLDTSGSMIGKPIEGTRAAALRLIERLSPGDRFAVVAFDTTARVVVKSTVVTASSRRAAQKAIGELDARGTTDLAAGLGLGLSQLALGQRAGTIDRIVLCGDGVPNDASTLPAMIQATRQARATITTLGLGTDNDEHVLGQLALDTGGIYKFLAEPAEVAAVFEQELVRMQQVVARNVRVTVRTGPGVVAEAMPGLDDGGDRRTAWLGDLAAGEVRDVIIPLSVSARGDGAVVELADVDVYYDDVVGPPLPTTLRGFVAATASTDAAAIAASVKLPIETARQRAMAASAILEAIRQARAGNVAAGLTILDAAIVETRAAATKANDAELAAFAERMVELRKNLAQIAVAVVYEPAPVTAAAEAVDSYRTVGGTGDAKAGEVVPVASPRRAPDSAERVIRSMHDEANYYSRH
jgi:Ca-activated chloride channel family protein